MGKRAARGQLLRALTKKQKRHLRDFGEEHPFHDRVSAKAATPQAANPRPGRQPQLPDASSSESEEDGEPQQVSGYLRLLATLKDVSEEDDDEEDEEDEDGGGAEAGSEGSEGGDPAAEPTESQAGVASDPEGTGGAGRPGAPPQEPPEDFTDTKHESLFSLESNFLEEPGGGPCAPQASADPFFQHVNRELKEKDVQAAATNPRTTQQLKWPVLGQVVFSTKFETLETFRPPKEVAVESLHLQKPLDATWPAANGPFLAGARGPFTPRQRELFAAMSAYRDVLFPERGAGPAGEEVRLLYCLHALNHVLKANARVLANNGRRRGPRPPRLGLGDDQDFRDQGLTRPKVLIVVPFREAALRVVRAFEQLLGGGGKVLVSNKKRFRAEYGWDPSERPPNLKRPADYEAVFAGNIDDHFRIGVAVLQRSVRLYAPFYSSDVLIASPLGLRTVIGADGDRRRDFDFLSSIELLVIDQADVYLMQNWEHVLHLMNHMNRLPTAPHGVDFSRVRMWSLQGWARHYRQTLLLGALQDAPISALFHKYCVNARGQVAVRSVPLTGSISHVLLQLPHVFQRLEADSPASVPDARFAFFVDKVLPQYRDAAMAHTLVFVPSYFDFVRLRNHFRREGLSCAHVCEYSPRPAVARARHFFLRGDSHFLLLTERFHFYKRYSIKGVCNLIFYELPTYAHFYGELCHMLRAGGAAEAAWTCTALYCRYDAQRLAAVVGVERAARMLRARKSAHLFVTGER